MREILTIIPRMIWGFGTGLVGAGGIVAFITIIGIVPIMAYRTKTVDYAYLYENAIGVGSMLGGILSLWEIRIYLFKGIIIIFGFAFGIFVGALIIALAEVLDVMPIIDRRLKIKKGISLIAFSLALGKLVGALYYYLYPFSLEIMK